MTPALINKTFFNLLEKGSKGNSLRKRIGMTSAQACYYRWRLAHYNDIRLQTKISWLTKAGYDVGQTKGYSRLEMVQFARFCSLKSNTRHLHMGFEFMLTQWEAREERAKQLRARK